VRARLLLVAVLSTALISACSTAGAGGAPAKPPVVVLIFDEFPLDTLLRPDGSIDAERYPNFARLAAMSTWFPNAHTVYDSTFKAVPAILDARLPRSGTAADFRSHLQSIYTLFHGLGYGVVDVESGEALCPPRICASARTRRPGVLARLRGGGRPARLHGWIGAIRRRPRPTLYLQHTLLPHEPWIYLPSGHAARPAGKDPIGAINRPIGFHDPELTGHNESRHLLQVGFVDRQVGLLLDRLERTDLLEDALLAVTADHGYAFELGVKDRRLVTESNVDEIAPVALFVKAPGQTAGRVNRDVVRNIDLVPTVAGLLGARVGWEHDGRSALTPAARPERTISIVTRDFGGTIRIGLAEMERRRAANRARRARTFLTGEQSDLVLGSPWASVYRVGSHAELTGRRLGDLSVAATGPVRVRPANAGLLRAVDQGNELLPTRVTGTLSGVGRDELRDLAVAVNGRVQATGRTFHLRGHRPEYFSMLVPEKALRPGDNRLEIFAVGDRDRLTPLYLGP
jgi:Sulfatase